MKINIETHNASKGEVEELIHYLKDNHWYFTTNEDNPDWKDQIMDEFDEEDYKL
jgi:hypothetical protein